MRRLRAARAAELRRRFRARHPSGLPLLGHFSSFHGWEGNVGFPAFHPAPFRGDPDLARAVRHGDFLLTRLEQADWRVCDCFEGRLLFTRCNCTGSESDSCITVFNPLSQRLDPVCDPNPTPDAGGPLQNSCLLPSSGSSSTAGFRAGKGFRVAGFQSSGPKIRLVVYDSQTGQWSFRSWVGMSLPFGAPMHACGCVYLRCLEAGRMLRLDKLTMELSVVTIPPGVPVKRPWCIGETEDGELCLVCVVHDMMEREDALLVWIHDDSKKIWQLKEEVILWSEVGILHRVLRICSILDGIVTLCLKGYQNRNHVAFSLTNLEVKAKFECSGVPFTYIMPCPWLHEGLFSLIYLSPGLSVGHQHSFVFLLSSYIFFAANLGTIRGGHVHQWQVVSC
ncbi:hypothetical protein ACP4OV_026390 [Aristida adscensionis]